MNRTITLGRDGSPAHEAGEQSTLRYVRLGDCTRDMKGIRESMRDVTENVTRDTTEIVSEI